MTFSDAFFFLGTLRVNTCTLLIKIHVWQGNVHAVIKWIDILRGYFLCGSFVLFMSCVCHAFTSVYCCLVVTWYLGSCLWCLSVFLSLSHVVSWVRCGTWFYRFLIFATFLTLITPCYLYPRYEVYRGYKVFAFSVIMFVCLFVCKLFFPSKISQQLLGLGFWN